MFADAKLKRSITVDSRLFVSFHTAHKAFWNAILVHSCSLGSDEDALLFIILHGSPIWRLRSTAAGCAGLRCPFCRSTRRTVSDVHWDGRKLAPFAARGAVLSRSKDRPGEGRVRAHPRRRTCWDPCMGRRTSPAPLWRRAGRGRRSAGLPAGSGAFPATILRPAKGSRS